MTTVVSLGLKSKSCSLKVPVMTDNTLTRATSFVNIYAFGDINSIILWHVRLIQLICIFNNYLKKTCWKYFLPSWKTDLKTSIVSYNFSVSPSSKSSSELNLALMFFHTFSACLCFHQELSIIRYKDFMLFGFTYPNSR